MGKAAYVAARIFCVDAHEGGEITDEVFGIPGRVPQRYHLKEKCSGHRFASLGTMTVSRFAVCSTCLQDRAINKLQQVEDVPVIPLFRKEV